MSSIDSAVQEIDARLTELRDEVQRLQSARDILAKGNSGSRQSAASPAPQTAPQTQRRKPGRPAGSGRVNRTEQALSFITSEPGITIPQLADKMKIQSNYLYRVVPKLAESGQVKRDGQGWHPVAA